MRDPLRVEIVRSGIVESVHLVDVAVVDERGALLSSAGDSDRVAAFRSAAKPIQAAACLDGGWDPHDERSVAVACGSHSGEPQHVEAVMELLRAAGVEAAALRCPAALPLDASAAEALLRRGGNPAPVFHNCSGKHSAMLATCAARGWLPEEYLEPSSSLQREIRCRIESLIGRPTAVATDGCGAPTFAAPLAAVASAFLVGVSTGAGARVASAMRTYPFLVAGSGRPTTALMEKARGLIVKEGAEGIACAAFPGCGLALKARDGAGRARDAALVEVLRSLRVIGDDPEIERLARPPVLGGGRAVGEIRVEGRLG